MSLAAVSTPAIVFPTARIDAVVWDLDGSLGRETELHAMPVAVHAVADYAQKQKSGLVITAEQRAIFVRDLAGKQLPEIAAAIFPEGILLPDGFKEEVFQRTLQVLGEKLERDEEAISTAVAIRSDAIKQWIATGSPPPRVKLTLEKTGLRECFYIENHDWFSAKIPKPDPQVYVDSLQSRMMRPSQVMAVEDSKYGVEAARSAGIEHIVGFIGGPHILFDERGARAKELKAAGAHYIVETLGEVHDLVRQHNAAYREGLRHGKYGNPDNRDHDQMSGSIARNVSGFDTLG